ncbi:4Fe-4S dicluster domain-containing protein [Thiospirochaeta perfilievii]|uniref:4Fe-4S dicluster domain-containing protein n=1 Tax=Thiospirochaeta perfilievii TaxID=252967 RepID=A0A5C1Q8S4_9SPIO|nr:4Fe-4S dicluster domain-containing protein [Thiospirochaeta perfilievii]QEN03901.1 4Fe-4S dicluster domain-containing protein [Thiospirochaeta perfilievii]
MKWKPDFKGILEPFSALKYLFQKPATLMYPYSKRETPESYRGFHTNLQAKCIGCGLCQDICMNEAIDMITPEIVKNPKNGSELIPRIDYGRCCWCSLCIDVCPTKSLKLGTDYSMVSDSADDFIFNIPDPEDKEKDNE